MKKTLIALMALAGVAVGETNTLDKSYTPLVSTDNWTHGTLNHTSWIYSESDQTLTYSPTGASGAAVSTYILSDALFAEEGKPLTFSFAISRGSANAGVSFALVGNHHAVVVGTKDYTSGELFSAVSDNVSAKAYYCSSTWASQGVVNVGGSSLLVSALNYNAVATISGSAVINEEGNTILTLSATSTTTEQTSTITYDLGKDFSFNKLVIGADNSGTGTGVWSVSGIQMAGRIIPEPATATLSLLALAGLAARRRRR